LREHHVGRSKPRPFTKPFSPTELAAKWNGEEYLTLAREYRTRSDITNAVSCCLGGIRLTFGISRPLAVRDELHDLLSELDPTGEETRRIEAETLRS